MSLLIILSIVLNNEAHIVRSLSYVLAHNNIFCCVVLRRLNMQQKLTRCVNIN